MKTRRVMAGVAMVLSMSAWGAPLAVEATEDAGWSAELVVAVRIPEVRRALDAWLAHAGATKVERRDLEGIVRYDLGGIADRAAREALFAQARRFPGVLGVGARPSPQAMQKRLMAQYAQDEAAASVVGFIVKFRSADTKARARAGEPLSDKQLERIASITGRKISGSRAASGETFVVELAEAVDLQTGDLLAARLSMDPEIEFASANGFGKLRFVPNDPGFAQQWNLTNPISGINVAPAWDITTGSTSLVIGVVDSGVLGHPDFSSRLLPGADFSSSPRTTNSGRDPGDWAPAGVCGTAAFSSTWHGTHVAGIIAAEGNNGSYGAGINWRSKILPVRVAGQCGRYLDSDVLDGLRWAAGYPVPGMANNPTPARVINASLGGPGDCLTTKLAYQQAILEATLNHVVVVVAAGNEGEDAMSRAPASCLGAITVAAVAPNGDKTFYSNYAPTVEIAAPGGDSRYGEGAYIYSTLASGSQGDPGSPTLGKMQGTSQAAPHVSGVVSLMLSVNPGLTLAQTRDIVMYTSSYFPAASACAQKNDCGVGIVNAAEAVKAARATTGKVNFSDLWWRSTESGWGVNFEQQGDIVFGTWFTYGTDGQPTWLVMSNLARVSEDVFAGDIYQTTGTPFAQISGRQAFDSVVKVGTAVLLFFGSGEGIFVYDMNGASGMKPIERQVFAAQPTCRFVTGSRAQASNYQDLWWNPLENGWGVNLAHQENTIFATWFTYGDARRPTWYVASGLQKTGPGSYSGRLFKTTGQPLAQINGATSVRSVVDVGEMSLTFDNGESGRMNYVVNGVAGSKHIERQVFSSPTSVCQ